MTINHGIEHQSNGTPDPNEGTQIIPTQAVSPENAVGDTLMVDAQRTESEHNRRKPLIIGGSIAAGLATVVAVGLGVTRGHDNEPRNNRVVATQPTESANPTITETTPSPTESAATPTATSESTPTATTEPSATPETPAAPETVGANSLLASVTPEQWTSLSSENERQAVLADHPEITSQMGDGSLLLARSQGFLNPTYIKKFQTNLVALYQNEKVSYVTGDPNLFSKQAFDGMTDVNKQQTLHYLEAFSDLIVNTGKDTYPLVGDKLIRLASMNKTIQEKDVALAKSGENIALTRASKVVVLDSRNIMVGDNKMTIVDVYSQNTNEGEGANWEYFTRYLMVPAGQDVAGYGEDCFAPVVLDEQIISKG